MCSLVDIDVSEETVVVINIKIEASAVIHSLILHMRRAFLFGVFSHVSSMLELLFPTVI